MFSLFLKSNKLNLKYKMTKAAQSNDKDMKITYRLKELGMYVCNLKRNKSENKI